ncbi:MAG: putative rane-bound dehydrogenase domain protein [Verrucomicrobiales bacterium]|nr:putative rane-bound dehydrogenase domain protein [Verrucomicrobiales bacterium]
MHHINDLPTGRTLTMNRKRKGLRVTLLNLFSIVAIVATSSAEATKPLAVQNGFPTPFNTEKSTEAFLSPEEAVKRISLPAGFNATLFAGEPDVQQPIGISTDDRGRLWIVENYTYSEGGVFEKKLRDRIIILEDKDHDGHFDKRTVFWDQGQKVTSAVWGFGGVWVLATPKLLFIPDRNGDDIPDGEPEVVLDGWSEGKIQHNVVNGLMWGPDGWLYGRHGILETSVVGKPGTPKKDRTSINCGIWRYHPTKKIFEVVAHGTTNPWGMDFDEHGEGFFINTVIGHLWHVIPGAHYKRMYGQDFNPHAYELIDQHADHYHWDTGRKWTETRDNKGSNDSLGGGHAHSGLMMYLGDNWPSKYHNTLFTVNLHGYRLNNDLIERSGAGYVGKHGEDFMKTTDKWFRAVDLIYGNDGGVFLADWSDTGECHESDGVHRSSGRIYKIVHGTPGKPAIADVSKLKDLDLVKLQLHENEWFARHARRVLQERAASGRNMRSANSALLKIFNQAPDTSRKLRAMWTLQATGGAGESWLTQQLKHPDEHVRTWAIRFLTEQTAVSDALVSQLNVLAKTEQSSFVRLALASALQRIPVDRRLEIVSALAAHAEDANDHNLPLMIWYGVEPLVGSDPMRTISLTTDAQIPLVRRLIARRISEEMEKSPDVMNALVLATARVESKEIQSDILQGMSQAVQGWRKAHLPKNWPDLRDVVAKNSTSDTKNLFRDLSLLFGDERAFAELKTVVLDESVEKTNRRAALQKLIENKSDSLPPFLQTLLANKLLAPTAAHGLAVYDVPNAAGLILSHYQDIALDDHAEVIGTLVSRPAYARALLNEVAAGKIPRRDISAYHARQIRTFEDKDLNGKLAEVWGEVRGSGKEKKETIDKFKTLLTTDRLKKADVPKGRELFNKACAVCHTLYGEGAKIGPDLTGSGRSNLDYLLENIIDPSAIVGTDFKMAVVTLKDERVLNGIITAQTDRTITLQSSGEQSVLERSEIVEIKNSALSLMPEGLLEGLEDEQIANLSSYLMSPQQVPLPKTR